VFDSSNTAEANDASVTSNGEVVIVNS